MSELRDLIKLIVLVTLIGVLGVALTQVAKSIRYGGDLTVDYTANLTISKVLLLQESYVYHVKAYRYKMLYRVWNDPLTLKKENFPCIVLRGVGNSARDIIYVKDYYGRVHVSNPVALDLVERLAERNEIGIVCSQYLESGKFFNIGDYSLNALYEIYPPIQTDGRFDHVNLKLASNHAPYPSVKIFIYDPNRSVLKVYPHMDDFRLRRVEDGWTIEGRSAGLVEVELILRHGAIEGFYQNVSNVLDLTEMANAPYYIKENVSKVLEIFYTTVVLGFPLIVLLVYKRYGREKPFVVPEYLSYVPNPNRKPWTVNVVFTGDAMRGDKNAFFATLLDLYRRGAIDVEPYEVRGLVKSRRELRIRILDKGKFDLKDVYEYRVLRFIERYSENDVLDTKRLREIARNRKMSDMLSIDLRDLLNWRDARFTRQFVETKGKKIFHGLTLAFLILTFLNLAIRGDLAILTLTLLAQSLCCSLSPSQLLGRWKEDYYREKLEWESFRRFLSNLAMIKKYAPEDVRVWKEWLVYGTALGVGDRVVEAMKSFNIEIPEVRFYSYYPVFVTTYRTSIRASSSSGGGFGAGGGFGGGGAGGR